MQIEFKVLSVREAPSPNLHGVVQLSPGDWDDYSFKTSFSLSFFDQVKGRINLGTLKIGYKGQTHGWTKDGIRDQFTALPDDWFSLGQDVEYYKKLANLPFEFRSALLSALRDVVADEAIFAIAGQEKVFKDSLTRGVSISSIDGQYRRVLNGEAERTDFSFAYKQAGDQRHASIELDFQVEAASQPSTNVHVLIGRNGVGKTTLLNNMVQALLGVPAFGRPGGVFLGKLESNQTLLLKSNYFSSVISVSFSAFDPFLPPADRPDRTLGIAYFYIGMKNARSEQEPDQRPPPKTEADLANDFVTSFRSCISQQAKRDRWLKAIRRLESDDNFAEMDLGRLVEMSDDEAISLAGALAGRMSSGHSIVLLTITKLVDTVEEKSLVLLDEPESHLHPPLLSAFMRALSDLLHSRNGVAIIATHSPVVLQEVPRSCVWKLSRYRAEGRADRPERETFGENVGILTREVFGFEVAKSGFHEMLQNSVDAGKSFDDVMMSYSGQLGTEAQAILLSLIAARDADGALPL